MTDIAFYHLLRSPLEAALPKLLERTLAAGKRALVVARSEDRVEALNAVLWTYNPAGWLPHGSAADGDGEDQPVFLSVEDEAPNSAEFLFLTDGATSGRVGDFERCFEIFDGTDESAVTAAREHWRAYKDAGHALTYWQQTDRGGWEEKA